MTANGGLLAGGTRGLGSSGSVCRLLWPGTSQTAGSSAGSVHARRNDTLITRAARFGCAGSAARVLPHDVMKEASLDLLIPPENSIDLTRCSREITSTLQSSLSARRCDSPRPGARLVPVPNKEPQGSADQSMKSNCDKVARGSGRKSEAEGRSDDK